MKKEPMPATPCRRMGDNLNIITTQRSFYHKARREKGHCFNDLHHFFYQAEWVSEAVRRVLSSPGARTAGVDRKTRDNFITLKQREALALEVQDYLRASLYVPHLMRTIRVPKRRKGGWRTISVPTIRDRVVGELMKMIIEPIFEADFLECSKGYRPGRGVMDSIQDCRRFVSDGQLWIARADIKNCFTRVDREKLVRLLRKRIADERVVDLIYAFLQAGALDRGFEIETVDGIQQGLVVTPLLANIYLTDLDKRWLKQFSHHSTAYHWPPRRSSGLTCGYSRYADDLIFFCRELCPDALCVLYELSAFLDTNMGMELSEKEIRYAPAGFDFLGFHAQWVRDRRGGHLHIEPAAASIQRFQQHIVEILDTGRPAKSAEVIDRLNQAISSFGSQFRFVQSQHQFHELDGWINQKIEESVSTRNPGIPPGDIRLRRLCDLKRHSYRAKHRNPFR